MKQYILCTILLGNLAFGMDAPDATEKAQFLDRLEKEWRSMDPGTRRSIELSNQIDQLRKELNPEKVIAELDKIESSMPAAVEPAPAAVPVIAPSKYQEKLDLIATLKPQELKDFEKTFNDPELPRSSSETDVIGKALAARRAKFKSVHFDQDAAANVAVTVDSNKDALPTVSVIPAVSLPVVKAEAASSGSDEPILPKIPAAKQHQELDDSNCARERIKPEDIPAPLTPDDFVDAMAPDENFKGSEGAQPAPVVVVGIDAVSVPVTPEASPLHHVKPLKGTSMPQDLPDRSSPRSPAPEKPDSLNPGEATDPETPQTPRGSMKHAASTPVVPAPTPQVPKVAIPATSGDAKLAEDLAHKLAQERKETAGGPASPRLPVKENTEPIVREGAIEDLTVKVEKQDQTPGGPEDLAEPVVQDLPFSKPEQHGLSAAQQTLLLAGAIVVVYAGTEVAVAYKSISHKQWQQTSGFMNKVKLVLGKTWENVKNRPSQLRAVAKQVPVAAASALEKMKAKAKAA